MSDPALRLGFHGKLPGRGDFVGFGLSAALVDAWHDWIGAVLPAARVALDGDWDASWLVAPVWRLALPPGLLGPAPCAGLWMPSVDRAGRFFPLLIAAEGMRALARPCLDRAEEAGRTALAGDDGPDRLRGDLDAIAVVADSEPGPGAVWSTEGGPYHPGGAMSSSALPDAEEFRRMIRA